MKLTVNGKSHEIDVEPEMPLLWVLRDELNLPGTKFGCGMAQCGACTVHVDGNAVRSCVTPVGSVSGAVTTVEGLGTPEALHPMQIAFHENHGLQCGFCTPGMLMSSVEFARRHPSPTEEEVRHWLEGNLCRCTGYQNIVKSVLHGTAAMHAEGRA